MRHLILPFLACFIFACSGGSHSSTPPPPPPPVAKAVPAGVYTAKVHTSGSAEVLAAVAPIGDITQTMVVDQFGSSMLELPGWNQVNAVLQALPDGTIQVGTTPAFVTADGTLSTLVLTNGTSSSTELAGTVNGGLTFDVILTATQNNPIDLSTKAGTWTSMASNTGWVLVLTMPAIPGQGSVYNPTMVAYANSTDAAAGQNALQTFQGNITWSQGDPTHSLNLFAVGWGSNGTGFVGGVAYFDTNGNLVMFTGRNSENGQTWNKQISAVFTKQ